MNEDNNKALSVIFEAVKFVLFRGVLPIMALLKINQKLGSAATFYKDTYFSRQVRKNLLHGVILTCLTLGSAYFLYDHLKVNTSRTMKILGQTRISLNKREATRSIERTKAAIQLAVDQVNVDSEFTFWLIMFSASVAGSMLITTLHPLNWRTRELKAAMLDCGVATAEKIGRQSLLMTPVGAYIELHARSPKEVAENDTFWLQLNTRVKSFKENPKKRTLVFFTKAFELKDKYEFKL